MTIHARLGRRHSSGIRAFYGGMAVTAVNPVIGDVVLVAELNGLRFDDVRLIPVRRARNPEQYRVERYGCEDSDENDRCPCERIRAPLENLAH